MYEVFQKLVFLFYYQKARNIASQENYLDAIELLNKAPFKEKSFFYYLLGAFLYERLFRFDESLFYYDKAKFLIFNNSKLNQDDKNYLFKYINNGYLYIYQEQQKYEEVKRIKELNKGITFEITKVNKSIKNDFVIG